MAKSLSLRIRERAANRHDRPREHNRAVVLALQREICQARAEGWALRTIWRTLHEEGAVRMSYQAFRLHVNRMVMESVPSPAVEPARRSAQPVTQPEPVRSSGSGFSFDPTAKKEELI